MNKKSVGIHLRVILNELVKDRKVTHLELQLYLTGPNKFIGPSDPETGMLWDN